MPTRLNSVLLKVTQVNLIPILLSELSAFNIRISILSTPSLTYDTLPLQVVTGLTLDNVNDPMFVSNVKDAVASVLILSVDDVTDVSVQMGTLKLRYKSIEHRVSSDRSDEINDGNEGHIETVSTSDHGRQLSEVVMQYTISTTSGRTAVDIKYMVRTAVGSGLLLSSLATRGVPVTSITDVKIYENSPTSVPVQPPILVAVEEG